MKWHTPSLALQHILKKKMNEKIIAVVQVNAHKEETKSFQITISEQIIEMTRSLLHQYAKVCFTRSFGCWSW